MTYTYRHAVRIPMAAWRYEELRETHKDMAARAVIDVFRQHGFIPVDPIKEISAEFIKIIPYDTGTETEDWDEERCPESEATHVYYIIEKQYDFHPDH